jgi:hypothetical protein
MLVDENVLSFSDIPIKISLSSGPRYPPIVLSVREFQPSGREFLEVQRISGSDQEILSTKSCYSLPLGLPSTAALLLKDKCRIHIESIVSYDRDYLPEQSEFGEMSLVSWHVYLAINRYRKADTLNRTVTSDLIPVEMSVNTNLG